MENQQQAGGAIKQNTSGDIDKYLFSDENYNGQNSIRENDLNESKKIQQHLSQQTIKSDQNQNIIEQDPASFTEEQIDKSNNGEEQEEIFNHEENFDDNQHDIYYNDGSYCNSNDNDSCLESKSLQNYNLENKERLKAFQMQQEQQNFKMNTLPNRTSADKDNINYLQTSMNYCNKTKDEIQEIIERIPYPDQLSMTSISNSTHSYIGSTPQRTLLDNNDFRQSKKSMKRGSFNRFNNEMQKMAQFQTLQNGKKLIHSKTEEDNNDIGLSWSKSNVKPGDEKNIFPQVFAPSIELSNENSMILKMMQQSNNDMNQVQKLNLATFGGFDTRHDEDIEDDFDNFDDESGVHQNEGQNEQVQKRMQQYQNQLPNQYNYNSQNGPYNLVQEDVENEEQYYIDDDQYQQQQRQYEKKSQKNSNIIDHSRNNIQNNNLSVHTQQNNSKSMNLIDKSRSQNFSLQEEQHNGVLYQNNSELDDNHYNDETNSYNNAPLQQQYQQQQYNSQKMHYPNQGHSQVNFSDNQIETSYISIPPQDQSVLKNLQQLQNQTINIMRKSDDDGSAMRIQISQLQIEKNQLMNKVQQLVHQASKHEQEKIFQASKVEDLEQVIKLLKEKYKDNGNLEKLRGRELENERQYNKRLKESIEQKNEKIQSLLDEIQKLESTREAYEIEFQQQRQMKQNDQQMLEECEVQIRSLQEEIDQLLIKKEEFETELQTKDFNLESMRQTYQQREKLINNELNKARMQFDKDIFALKQEIQILNKAKELDRQKLQMKEQNLQNDILLQQAFTNLNEEVEELRLFNERKDQQIEMQRLELDQYKDEVRQSLLQNFSYWIKTDEFKNSENSIMIEIVRAYIQELKYENEGLSHSVKQNNKQKIENVSELRKIKNENHKLKDEVLNLSTLNDDKINLSGISRVDDKQESYLFNEQINKLNNQLFKQRQEYEQQIEKTQQECKEQIDMKQNELAKTNFEIQILSKENESLMEEIAQLKSMTQTGQNIINELENKLKKQQLQIQSSSLQKNFSQSSQASLEQSAQNQELELKNMQRIIEQEKTQLNEAQLKFEEEIQLRYEEVHLKEQELSKRQKGIQQLEEEVRQQKETFRAQQQSQQQHPNSASRSTTLNDTDRSNQKEVDQIKSLQTSLKREIQEKDLLKIENDHLIEQIENKEKEINSRDALIKQLEEKSEKQDKNLKEEKKNIQELQKENKVLLDNINQLKINYEKMQTQFQTNVNQLRQKQLELQTQIKNTKQLSRTNKNLSQTNLDLLSKISNLNEQITNIEQERNFFKSQPSPIYHNKAKSCQYNNKGLQDFDFADNNLSQNRKRKASANSASSTKRENKSLLYLIQNTLNNSSHNIRQSTFPNEYSNRDQVLEQPTSAQIKQNQLHQTHPSQNNLSLESFYHNTGGNNNLMNSQVHTNNRQNSYKNLISSVLPLTQQNGKITNRLPPSVHALEQQGDESNKSQNQGQQNNHLANNLNQKRKEDNLFSSQNSNFIINSNNSYNQISNFNRKPSSISDALQILSINSGLQQKINTEDLQSTQPNQITKAETDATIRLKSNQQTSYINQNNENQGQSNCQRCNSQLHTFTEDKQSLQQVELMKEQMENYEQEFIQMKEYFINKLKDVNTTIKDLELQKNILEKENQDLRTFKADYYTQVTQLEQQKAIVERQIYNSIMSQKRQEQTKEDDNSLNNIPLTIAPEMLSAEETLELMQEILRKVVKSNEMAKILSKSIDLKNLIFMLQQQKQPQQINTQQSSIQQFNSSQQSYNNINNQSAPNLFQNYQSTQPFYNQSNQISAGYHSKTKRMAAAGGYNGAYLNSSVIEPNNIQRKNQNQSLINPNDTLYNNQFNYSTLDNTSSLIINPVNNQALINKQLFNTNDNKTQKQLQRLLEDKNKKLNYQSNDLQFQSHKGYQSQQLHPKISSQMHFYPQNSQNLGNNNQQIQQQIQYQQQQQNNYYSVQDSSQHNQKQNQGNSYVLNYYNNNKGNNLNLPLSSRRDKKQQFLSLDQNIKIQ